MRDCRISSRQTAPIPEITQTVTHYVRSRTRSRGSSSTTTTTTTACPSHHDIRSSGPSRQRAPSGIRRFFELAEEMDDIISLGVGEPDFSAPWSAREAAIASLDAARPPTPPSAGSGSSGSASRTTKRRRTTCSTTPMRKSSSRRVRARLALARRNPGPSATPAWNVSNVPGATFAGIDVIDVPTARKTSSTHPRGGKRPVRRRPTHSYIAARAIRPYATMTAEEMADVAAVCRENDLLVFADEIYAVSRTNTTTRLLLLSPRCVSGPSCSTASRRPLR